METTESRLVRRIRRDFPEPGSAPEVIRLITELAQESFSAAVGTERVQAAIILFARGNISRLRQAFEKDWRDLLMDTDLANDDWPARLDWELGPEIE
jgi:hypothetical protein